MVKELEGKRKMNKPLTMVIKETKKKLANICNESGLPPVILDLIMQGIYSEIHSLAERQLHEEEIAYAKSIGKNIENNNQILEGDTNE